MHPLSQKILEKLWNSADGANLKASAKAPTLAFTSKSLPGYFSLPTARDRETVHAELMLAQSRGAIIVEWDKRGVQLQVTRIRLSDFKALSQLLGYQSTMEKVEEARSHLAPYLGLPGVNDLLAAWASDASPRKLSVDKLSNVIDACRIVTARSGSEATTISLRRLSARLLGDSKRAETLAIPLDVVMHGLAAEPLDADQVFERLGLLRFPLPMMIAGPVDVILVSGQSIACPSPYIGIPPQQVQGIRGEPRWLLTIENLTVFHELANGQGGPVDGVLIYTAGQPGRQWLGAYGRILRALKIPVFHWGDTDEGGFCIADRLGAACEEAGVSLDLWTMGSYQPDQSNRDLLPAALARILEIADHRGWRHHLRSLEQCGKGIEQEIQDLALPLRRPPGE